MTAESPKLKNVFWKRSEQAIRVILEKVKDLGKDKASPLMDQEVNDVRVTDGLDIRADDMFPGGNPF